MTPRFCYRAAQALALALFASMAMAQDVPVQSYTLKNGMKVILREDHTVPLVTVNIWYWVGSKDEPPHHSGFAHLFEHLMFMGTHRVQTGMYDKIMEGGGGNNNASTEEDRTNFYDIGPSNLLPTLLWLEADRLQDLGRFMTQRKLNLQRDVVKNERRQNTENTPYGTAYERINGLMFPPGHPYHTSVIGSMSDLDNASVADVQKFFATYYVPNNASMVVAGDFDSAKTKASIAKEFGTLPRRPAVPRKPKVLIPFMGVKQLTLTDKVAAPKLIMVWHSPAAYKPGDVEMQLAGSVLSDGISSRLYQRLVVKDKLATDVSASQEERLLGSLFYIDVTAVQGADLKKLQSAIDDELTKFKKAGPKKDELKRQSAKIQSATLDGLQSIQTVADALNNYEFYLGKPNSFRQQLALFQKATPNSVRVAAADTLSLGNRLILTVLPGDKVSGGSAPLRFASEPQAKDPRDTRPPIGKPKLFAAHTPTQLTLANGMTLFYWQRGDLPLMTLALRESTASKQESPSQAGLTSLMMDMLDEGAGKRDAKQFQNALDILGASFSAGAGRHSTSATLNTLAANFRPALSLFADAILRPRFAKSDFDRVKRVTIAGLDQRRDEVAAVASEVAMRQFFGKENPYGNRVSGNAATVGRMTLQDVKRAYGRHFSPDSGLSVTFLAAGSLSPSEVKRDLDHEFRAWHEPHSMADAFPDVPEIHWGASTQESADALRVFIVDKPGAPQTAVYFMAPAPTYETPERLKLEEINTILGGSFTSRLNSNLREDKGYTYGADSTFQMDLFSGDFVAAAQVRADVTGNSIQQFLLEFDRVAKGDISSAEVTKAAATIRAEEINQLETIEGTIGEAMQLASVNRPFSALTQDERAYAKITAAQLNKLAKTAIAYKQGILVLVGDKAAILPQLKDLGLPEPVEVKAD